MSISSHSDSLEFTSYFPDDRIIVHRSRENTVILIHIKLDRLPRLSSRIISNNIHAINQIPKRNQKREMIHLHAANT